MKRLPVTEDKLTLILDFLKENKDNAYTRRQIAQYLWDTYSYCEFKTFDQILREVSDKITKNVNKENYYVQTVPRQIEEHNTFPFSYQYLDVTKNTTLQTIETKSTVKINDSQQLHFEDFVIDQETVSDQEEIIQIMTEEANLLEDVKASDKISKLNDNEAFLIHWLNTTDDKSKTISQIIKIVANYA